MSDNDRNNLRMGLYVVAGAYLIYTAWQLFQGLSEADAKPRIFVTFILLFAVGGAALIGYAARNLYKQYTAKDGSQEVSTSEEDAAQSGEEKTAGEGSQEAITSEDDAAKSGEEEIAGEGGREASTSEDDAAKSGEEKMTGEGSREAESK